MWGHGIWTRQSGVCMELVNQGQGHSPCLDRCWGCRQSVSLLPWNASHYWGGRNTAWESGFALEWPACLHKGQTLSWWVCLVQSIESLLLPRWGWWKSSATVACRILAFVWSADFLKKRIKLWDFWRGCDIPSLFYIAVWPIEEDWTMKFSRVGDISSSSGTCSPRHIKPLACSKGLSTKAVRCWYRSLAVDLESKLLWNSLTDELEKGWVLYQGTAWNNGAVIGNLT